MPQSRIVRSLFSLILLTAACGIQRPLVRPGDIPEYERKRQEKIEKRRIDPVAVPATPSQQGM